jgi:hypothetical protein
MPKLTEELKVTILQSARNIVERGHQVGGCKSEGGGSKANPSESYCLRGALDKAMQKVGFDKDEAFEITMYQHHRFGLNLGGKEPCIFSDENGKDGCLRVIDKVLAKAKVAA